MKKHVLSYGRLLTLATGLLLTTGVAQAQSWEWAAATTRLDFATVRIAQASADAQGNVYVTGTFRDVVNFGTHRLVASRPSSGYQANPDLFVAKLTPGGQWEWAVQAGGTDGTASGSGLALDPDGQNLYVTGASGGQIGFGSLNLPGSYDTNNGFVAKLTSGGQWQWVVRTGNCGRPVLDKKGTIYVSGSFAGSTLRFGPSILVAPYNDSNVFVAWMNASGQWLGAVSGGGNGFEEATSLAVDGQGNAYVGGRFSSFAGTTTTFGTISLTPIASGTSDNFVAKLDSTRHWQWARRGGPFYQGGEPPKVAVASDGRRLVWGGTMVSDVDFGPYRLYRTQNSGAVVVGLDRWGTWQWVTTTKTPGSGATQIADIASDELGNWYAAGMATGTNTFGSKSVVNTIGTNVFAARLDGPTGAWQWVAPTDGNGLTSSIAVRGGHAYVAGYYNQDSKFGPFQLTTPTTLGSDGFVARVGASVLASYPAVATATAGGALYPVPAPAANFTLHLPAHFTTARTVEVSIGNTLGARVYQMPALALAPDGSLTTSLSAPQLSAGVYWLRVQAPDGVAATYRLVLE